MRRPFVLRLLPDRLKLLAWAWLYRPCGPRWKGLYQAAPLSYAPRIAIELLPNDVISDAIAFTGIYELKLTLHLVRRARLGGTLVDVGANLGYFSFLWAAASPCNTCVAFEASPRNVELLRRNVERNGLARRIDIVPKAAGKAAGTALFDPGPPDQTGWGGLARTTGPSGLTVQVVRVDEYVKGDESIALLKIDVEGADTWVLMGCERLLRKKQVEAIWFEQNKPRMRALGIGEDEAEKFLRSVGYKLEPRSDPAGEVVDWYASPA